MSVVDVFEYKYAKRKRDEIESFLIQIDTICDILYNNLEYKGVWGLIDKIEDVRIENYVLWHEYDQIIKKGSIDE